jgi:hypothetical protein
MTPLFGAGAARLATSGLSRNSGSASLRPSERARRRQRPHWNSSFPAPVRLRHAAAVFPGPILLRESLARSDSTFAPIAALLAAICRHASSARNTPLPDTGPVPELFPRSSRPDAIGPTVDSFARRQAKRAVGWTLLSPSRSSPSGVATTGWNRHARESNSRASARALVIAYAVTHAQRAHY